MGLDMYLFSLPKISGMTYEEIKAADLNLSEHKANQDEVYQKVKPHLKHFNEFGHSWTSLYEEVAYWRKANQIHHWFVENLHEGKDEPVFTQELTKDNLKQLYDLCVRVLKDFDHSPQILPTRPGPFFGSTSYGDIYYEQVMQTIILFDNLLKNFNFKTHYLLYQCSW
ncbi:hypothetical protein [Neobacillus sp. Marseille-QA0830]